jgi:hypothetical protein
VPSLLYGIEIQMNEIEVTARAVLAGCGGFHFAAEGVYFSLEIVMKTASHWAAYE